MPKQNSARMIMCCIDSGWVLTKQRFALREHFGNSIITHLLNSILSYKSTLFSAFTAIAVRKVLVDRANL
jgi:hypothetical protein